MDTATFWALIETARADAHGDIERQTALLVERLSQLPEKEIIGFQHVYHDMMDEAYRYDLWEAAGLILCGCTPDSFLDFRAWLIAHGESVFRNTLAYPDSLAEMVDDLNRGDAEYEFFGYLASFAYQRKMGKDLPIVPGEFKAKVWPDGEQHKEEEIPRLFPRLAAKLMDCSEWWRWYVKQADRDMKPTPQPSKFVHPAYPTSAHAAAAEAIVDFFQRMPGADAVLLVNSCARGKATPDSCLDINVLAEPVYMATYGPHLNREWEAFYASDPVFKTLRAAGAYSEVHLDILDGQFTPAEQDEMGPPDYFEVSVGNLMAYSHPLWQRTGYLGALQEKWLPYYDEDLRRHRLERVRWFCLNQLHHVPLYVARGLYFQAFDRLYFAFQDFLQALFIARRTYPIAYNKWIREQVVDILGLPDLYAQLPGILEVAPFESPVMAEKARALETLLDEYAPAESGL